MISRPRAAAIGADNVSRILGVAPRWLVAACLLFFLACDDPNDVKNCEETINPNLHRVLYWGEDEAEPGHDIPNAGFPSGDVLLPRWIDDSSILIFGVVLYHSEAQRGIFRLDLNANQQLTGITRHVYDGFIYIREYDWLPASNEVVVYYSKAQDHLAIAKGQLNATLDLGAELVSTNWLPGGAVHWPGHDGFVFHGTNPSNQKSGFYWMRDDGTSDSLLVEFVTSLPDARSFDFSYDGRFLYTATTSGDYPYMCDLFEFDLSTGIGTVIFEGRGRFVSLEAHPSEPRVLLGRYYDGGYPNGNWVPPGSYVDIIDRVSGDAARVDLNTDCYPFIISREPVWRPSGRAFAFLAGGFSGEGDNWPLELWIRRLNR